MARYERYKDSGVEWLGEVPEHWDVKRLGTWFAERKTKVSDKDYAPLSVTKTGILPQLESAAKTNDGDNRKLVLSGDYVINSRSDRKGSSGLSLLDGSVSLINIVMQLRNIHSKFCEYMFKSDSFVEEFYRNGHGIVADLWTTRYDEMKNIPLAYPPLEEQERIATFLDKRCTKIDKAIEQKARMIELLIERRQIIIQRAVTRGLNPYAPLTDSGIDWIGEIPSHWQVKKITHIFDNIGSGSTPTSGDTRFYDGNINWLQTGDLSDGTIISTSKKINNNAIASFPALKLYPKGSLVIAMYGATIGKLGVLGTESTTNQACCVLSKHKGILVKYVFYWMYGMRRRIVSLGYGGGQPNISQDTVKSFRLSLPSMTEQEQIIVYLDSVTQKIEKAISLKKQEIERLKEYRQTLVDSAVTGKIKVE